MRHSKLLPTRGNEVASDMMFGAESHTSLVDQRDETRRLPRTLRMSCTVLFSGIGCTLMCPALAFFLWREAEHALSAARSYCLYGVVGFMALMGFGGLYLVAAWLREHIEVTERGLVWDRLFGRHELRWSQITRAVWTPDKGGPRVRFATDNGKLLLWLNNFPLADRRWFADLIHAKIAPELQEGWDCIETMRERGKRPIEPVRHGDRWLLVLALAGLCLLLMVWPGIRLGLPRAVAAVCFSLGVLVSPIVLVLSGWDLLRLRFSPWLPAAFTITLLSCGLLAWILATLAGRSFSTPE